jgi:hypothetical protein
MLERRPIGAPIKSVLSVPEIKSNTYLKSFILSLVKNMLQYRTGKKTEKKPGIILKTDFDTEFRACFPE